MSLFRRVWNFVVYHRIKIAFLWFFVSLTAIGILMAFLWFLQNKVVVLQADVKALDYNVGRSQQTYEYFLFNDHLQFEAQMKQEQLRNQIATEYTSLQQSQAKEQFAQVDRIYSLYQETLAKLDRHRNASLSTSEVDGEMQSWGDDFLNKKYDDLTAKIAGVNNKLDTAYQTYLASLQPVKPVTPPVTPPVQNKPATGYSFQTVSTERGSFSVYMIKLPLSGYTVKTVAGDSSDCTNNCTAKPLATYVQDNGGYAGINGTYFCPPDYSSCSGKSYSYDFPVFDSNTHTWRNAGTLKWNDIGLLVFNGSTPLFFDQVRNYAGEAVTAGIGNFPPLLKNATVIVDENKLSSYQKTRGIRGAIGVGQGQLFLTLASGASVTDNAYILKALGAVEALNIDGGGSSALYINGSYKVGPGRKLPNAIVVVKK